MGRRARHPRKGNKLGDKLVRETRESRPREGGHQREQEGKRQSGKLGDKLGDKLADKGGKSSGRHTIQQRETKRETMGDNPKQGGQTHHPTKGNKKGHKGRQDLGKADPHVGRQ